MTNIPRKLRIKRKISWCLIMVIQRLRILIYGFLSTNRIKGTPQILQPALMIGNGLIEFGSKVKLGYFPSPFFLSGNFHLETRSDLALIKIGENTHINNNFVAIVEHKNISIGKRCLIGTNVEIYDSDFHGISISTRKLSSYEMAKSVRIEDDVFIGANVKILKGSVIGSGAVIANGAVVVGKIPSNVVAGGIPAKVLKAIEQ